MSGKNVLLIIGGGIAAYKSLDLIRRLKESGASVRVVMTKAAQHFVTPLAAGALAGGRVYTDLFDQAQEFDVGHIRLARECDLIIVAPATADLMAKAAHGLANDLASAILLATDKPALMAPAMNPRMWAHAATRRNFAALQADGLAFIGPNEGEMAERGERGIGRMAEPDEIRDAALAMLSPRKGILHGRKILVTAGPTLEPIDPVRFLSNRSSGKQGYAIAAALAELGAKVKLISGPTALPDPVHVKVKRVETAADMLAACEDALPVDAAIMVAAVADWRPAKVAPEKLKKKAGERRDIVVEETPDILATMSKRGKNRPALVIGFAAETENVEAHARAKIAKKGCDWIVANDVSGDVMGGADNQVLLITRDNAEAWPRMSKREVARKLAARIAEALAALDRKSSRK